MIPFYLINRLIIIVENKISHIIILTHILIMFRFKVFSMNTYIIHTNIKILKNPILTAVINNLATLSSSIMGRVLLLYL